MEALITQINTLVGEARALREQAEGIMRAPGGSWTDEVTEHMNQADARLTEADALKEKLAQYRQSQTREAALAAAVAGDLDTPPDP